jgi:hypothetical protein
MNAQRHDRATAHEQGEQQRGKELLVFLAASVVGIYGLGQGLAGLYERGQQISLLWLAVTGLAFFVLFGQMGRVYDTWPHRPREAAAPTADPQTLPEGGTSLADESK